MFIMFIIYLYLHVYNPIIIYIILVETHRINSCQKQLNNYYYKSIKHFQT